MNNSRFVHASAFALLAAFPVMLIAYVIYATQLPEALNYVSYLFIGGALVVGQLQWRAKGAGGYMSYGHAFVYGLFFTITYSILMTVWTGLFVYALAPDFMDRAMEQAMAEFEKEEDMPAEQIEMAMGIARSMLTPGFMITVALLGNLFVGVIISLITSAFTRKDRDPFQQQMQQNYQNYQDYGNPKV